MNRWDVRSLAGHTARAILTLNQYLNELAVENKSPINAVDYFLAATDDPTGKINDQVYKRGVEASKLVFPELVIYVGDLTKIALNEFGKYRDDNVLHL